MIPKKRLYLNREGRLPRSFDISLHPSLPDFSRVAAKRTRSAASDWSDVEACFFPSNNPWDFRYIGIVRVREDCFTLRNLVHEASHVAVHIMYVDRYGKNVKLKNPQDEELAYLTEDVFQLLYDGYKDLKKIP